jgi:F-type H+-transporting ATPase subunit delta
VPAHTGSAARRYAEAVFELAKEEDRLDGWDRDLAHMARAFTNGDEALWLQNPEIPLTDKEALLDELLADTSEEARNLAKLLAGRGRGYLAPQILAAYRRDVEQERGIAHAQVTTAVPLSAQEQTAIHDRLVRVTGQQVTMELDVDPTIIGGIIVRIGDKLIDGSARARLIELKHRLAGTAR